MPIESPPVRRLVSLDQFRGYTVAAMLLVNFVGGFTAGPFLLKHHNSFCSYADTVMPQFLFAVGFAFRLSFGRRALAQGAASAYARVVRRLVGLALVALFIFQMDGRLLPTYWIDLVSRGAWHDAWRPFRKDWTQTLFHIALTTLWIVPVIRASARWRIAYLVASALAHVISNHAFYYGWLHAPPVTGHTGGPLGFLTWCVPTLVGTLACDAVVDPTGRPRLGGMVVAAIGLMALGYLMSCGTRWYDVRPDGPPDAAHAVFAERPVVPGRAALDAWKQAAARGQWSALLAEPPFVPPPEPDKRQWNYWMMSVQSTTLSFMTYNAGFSLLVYALFYLACDWGGWQLGVFRTLGRNALAGYLVQWPLDEIFTDLVERTSTAWGTALGFPPEASGRSAPALFVWIGLGIFFAANWIVLRLMERKNIFLKL